MDFIKNNWGFLLITLICLSLLGVAVGLCVSSAGKLKKNTADAEAVQASLEKIGKANMKLTQENVELAQKNEIEAEKGLKSFKSDMLNRFRLKIEVPKTPIEGLLKLKDNLSALQMFLDEKQITYSAACQYFTFESIAKSTTPPHKDDLKEIFRQFAIVKQVVETAAAAEVMSIDLLERPMGLTVPEEGSYKFTPIEITITASAQNAQKFVNLMGQAGKFLFFLRTLDINAVDVPTSVAQDLKDGMSRVLSGASAGAGGAGGGGADMGPGGMGGGMERTQAGGRRRRGRGGQDMNPEMGPDAGGMNPGMMDNMGGNNFNNQSNLVEIPMKRQELLAFEPKITTWNLRFDMIEFIEAEEENGDAEQTDGAQTDSENTQAAE